jgi:hypothetical protein
MNTRINAMHPDAMPATWAAVRDRWELGHAMHAALFGAALVLPGRGGGTPAHGARLYRRRASTARARPASIAHRPSISSASARNVPASNAAWGPGARPATMNCGKKAP